MPDLPEILVPPQGVDLDDELRRIEIAYLEAALRRAGTKNGASLLGIPVQKMKYLCRKRHSASPGEKMIPAELNSAAEA